MDQNNKEIPTWEMNYFAKATGLFTKTLWTKITFSFLFDWITIQHSALSIMTRTEQVERDQFT